MILKFLKRLENLERNYPRIFWPCAGLLGFFLFHEPVQNPYKPEVIVQQVRGGSKDSENRSWSVQPSKDSEKMIFLMQPSKPQKFDPKKGESKQDPNNGIKPVPKIKQGPTGPGGGGGDSGGGYADNSLENENSIPPEERWKYDSEYWTNYKYDPDDFQSDEDSGESEGEGDTCGPLKPQDQTPIQGECRPRVLRDRIDEDAGLIRAAKKACKNREVEADINAMEKLIRQGNMNPGIGSKPVGEGITEFRGKNGGRILARDSENGVVEILGKSGKRPRNQQYVIDQAKKIFPKNEK